MSIREVLSQGATHYVQVGSPAELGHASHLSSNDRVSVAPSPDGSRFPRAPAMPGKG